MIKKGDYLVIKPEWRDAGDEAFDGFGVELAERRMRPSDDAGGHGLLSLAVSC